MGHLHNCLLFLLSVPGDLCMLGCVFYITDYHKYLDAKDISDWKKVQCDRCMHKPYTHRCAHTHTHTHTHRHVYMISITDVPVLQINILFVLTGLAVFTFYMRTE